MTQPDLVEELRMLGATPRGRYESTKLALMEACWKHESTDEAEQALDKAVNDWVAEGVKVGGHVGGFILTVALAFLVVWGLKIMWGWLF